MKDLDRQWIEIRTRILKGEKPYAKMKGFVQACGNRPDASKQLKEVNDYLAGMMKKEEEDAAPTCSEVKEILIQLG